jgi:hypothetical protein
LRTASGVQNMPDYGVREFPDGVLAHGTFETDSFGYIHVCLPEMLDWQKERPQGILPMRGRR